MADAPEEIDRAARDSLVGALRAAADSHIAHRHQVLVLSGAVTGAAVSTQPSGLMLLGLSLLSTAFAFAMLNRHNHVLVINTFLAGLEDAHGEEQRAWLEHLRRSGRGGPQAWLYSAAVYAVPGLSGIGSLAAFVHEDSRDYLIVLPVVALLAFTIEAFRMRRRFSELYGGGHRPSATASTSRERA